MYDPPQRASVRRAILVDEPPAAIGQPRVEVVIRITHGIPGGAVADFDEDDIARGPVDEVMGVARTRLEACAHAGPKRRLPSIGHERRLAFEDVYELVLL